MNFMSEIGTYIGESAECFALKYKQVFTVDNWDSERSWRGNKLSDAKIAYFQRMKGYSNVKNINLPSVEASKTFDNNSLDFVRIFADGKDNYS